LTPYLTAITAAMKWLSDQPDTIFLGQCVVSEGTALRDGYRDVPMEKRVELPVFENTQLGLCTGLALAGYCPIASYPRINFLLCAVDQLVLHLDKIALYSDGGYTPRVIIRTAVATPKPMDPGPQHLGDYARALDLMTDLIQVMSVRKADEIMDVYQEAYEWPHSTIVVEDLGLYYE